MGFVRGVFWLSGVVIIFVVFVVMVWGLLIDGLRLLGVDGLVVWVGGGLELSGEVY